MHSPQPFDTSLAQAARPFFDQAWAAASELGHSDMETVERLVSSFKDRGEVCDVLRRLSPYLLEYVQTVICNRRYNDAMDSYEDIDPEHDSLALIYSVRKMLYLRFSVSNIYFKMKKDLSLVGFCEETGQTAADMYLSIRQSLQHPEKLPEEYFARVAAYANADNIADEAVINDLICTKW